LIGGKKYHFLSKKYYFCFSIAQPVSKKLGQTALLDLSKFFNYKQDPRPRTALPAVSIFWGFVLVVLGQLRPRSF